MSTLRAHGYSAIVYETSPQLYVVPQTRGRLYILASLLLTAVELEQAAVFVNSSQRPGTIAADIFFWTTTTSSFSMSSVPR